MPIWELTLRKLNSRTGLAPKASTGSNCLGQDLVPKVSKMARSRTGPNWEKPFSIPQPPTSPVTPLPLPSRLE